MREGDGALPPLVRRGAIIGLLLSGASTLVIVLVPRGDIVSGTALWLWHRLSAGMPGGRAVSFPEFAVLANVGLFVPFFALVSALRPRWWWIAVGVGTSLGIELAQAFIPSRRPDVADVLSNSLGAVGGVLLGLLVRRWWEHIAARGEVLGAGIGSGAGRDGPGP